MLKEAEKIKCRVFLTPTTVTKGTYNLNLAFVAYLFNHYPALEMPDMEVEVVEETREEKSMMLFQLSSPTFRSQLAFIDFGLHVGSAYLKNIRVVLHAVHYTLFI